MREVNFSIPNVNKASVGITTALYDRRALDCTSTLPLINSLNHLAYLTTSSARIRDILTIDGGIERLICILKQGRSQEMMDMWKWNLAFQCVVNIGVRGSESVRTRVVEADMVPVIATILDNYINVIDTCREKAEAEHSGRKKASQNQQAGPVSPDGEPRKDRGRQVCQHRETCHLESSSSSRRQDPPPAIEIPPRLPRLHVDGQASNLEAHSETNPTETTSTLPSLSLSSPSDRNPALRYQNRHHHHHHHHSHRHHQHHHHRSQDSRAAAHAHTSNTNRHISMQSLPATVPSIDSSDGLVLRSIRDADRIPSIVPPLQTGVTSQPDSPTTPGPPSIQSRLRSTVHQRRDSVLQQSNSGDSDDANADEAASEASVSNEHADEPMLDIQTAVELQDNEDQETILANVSVTATLQNASEGSGPETFNITHQSANDGSIINTHVTPTNDNIGLHPPVQPLTAVNPGTHTVPQASQARFLLERSVPPGLLAATPRDEDVLMSLQLLAYVSKYCNLRAYFQRSHLVPRLKIRDNLAVLDDHTTASKGVCGEDGIEDEEYLLPDDFNIFPLVEKFTVRHHSQEMQHWAGVVMRNLCRKDDARGGIRQCAYYECGKWEQWTRQFAKCRRCRRTKYCSKECQKNAWVFHRHWCQVAS